MAQFHSACSYAQHVLHGPCATSPSAKTYLSAVAKRFLMAFSRTIFRQFLARHIRLWRFVPMLFRNDDDAHRFAQDALV
jgi:hypothetical protein